MLFGLGILHYQRFEIGVCGPGAFTNCDSDGIVFQSSRIVVFCVYFSLAFDSFIVVMVLPHLIRTFKEGKESTREVE